MKEIENQETTMFSDDKKYDIITKLRRDHRINKIKNMNRMKIPQGNDRVLLMCYNDKTIDQINQIMDQINCNILYLFIINKNSIKPFTEEEECEFLKKVNEIDDFLMDKNKKLIAVKIDNYYDIYNLIRNIYNIIYFENLDNNKIFIDIAQGNNKFSVAATICSMMFEKVVLIELDYINIIDSAPNVLFSTIIKTLDIKKPTEKELKQLKIFSSIPLNERENVKVIEKFIIYDLWKDYSYYDTKVSPTIGTSVELQKKYDNIPESKKFDEETRKIKQDLDSLKRREAVKFQRMIVEKWTESGWIYKNEKHHDLTEKGKQIVELFCTDEIYNLENEKYEIDAIFKDKDKNEN